MNIKEVLLWEDAYGSLAGVADRRSRTVESVTKDISTAGDALTSEAVHTPVGGSVRSIKRKTIDDLFDAPRLDKLNKAIDNGLMILNKDWAGKPWANRFIVAGYASPVMIDRENHVITHKALRDDLPRFMANDGEYANINLMHQNLTVGKALAEFTDAAGKTYKTEVDDVGLFIVAEIRTDDAAPPICKQVIDDILKGELKCYSISGHTQHPKTVCDDTGCHVQVDDISLAEITLCFEGVNPKAEFEVISKSYDVWYDALQRQPIRYISKQGPPRPGLVPQSGDPEHPKHWIRPNSGVVTAKFSGKFSSNSDWIKQAKKGQLSIEEYNSHVTAGLQALEQTAGVSPKAKKLIEGIRRNLSDRAITTGTVRDLGKLSNEIKDSDPQTNISPESPAIDTPSIRVKEPESAPSTIESTTTAILRTKSSGKVSASVLEKVGQIVPESHLKGVSNIAFESDKFMPGTGMAGYFFQGNIKLWGAGHTPHALVHEIGHSLLDSAHLPQMLSVKMSGAWNRARKTNSGFVSEYAKENSKEFWAESYAVYMQDRSKLEKRNPQVAALLDRVVEYMS
jgi:hypothetical protein